MKSDYFESSYYYYLSIASNWLGMSTAFWGASFIGLEIMNFHPTTYKSSLMAGRLRIWIGILHILLGGICMYAGEVEDWRIFTSYLLGITSSGIFGLASVRRNLIPIWLMNSYWPWVISNGIVAMFLIFSTFTKSAHTLRMTKLRDNILNNDYTEEDN